MIYQRKKYPHYLRLDTMHCDLHLPVDDSQSFPASSLWLYHIFDNLPLSFSLVSWIVAHNLFEQRYLSYKTLLTN